MSRISPEYLGSDPHDRPVDVDLLLRQVPDEEEDEEDDEDEGDGKKDDDNDEETDNGNSE
jgi:hypothetical protein